MPCGASRSSRISPARADSAFTIGWSAAATSGSARPNASTATISAARARGGDRLAEHDAGHARERLGVAREPARRVGAGRLRQHARDRQPAVGRADAVKAAEARGHAHRATGIRAERRVARPRRHRRGRAGRGPAGDTAGRARIERRPVKGVLAEDAEGHLVRDGLADQRGAGVEQGLDRPGVARGDRVLAGPVRIAAARRMARDVEEVLGREGEVGERAARASGHAHLDAGHEGVEGVGAAGSAMAAQPTKTPPEGCRISPVKNADSSDARKSAVLAISCGGAVAAHGREIHGPARAGLVGAQRLRSSASR